MGVVGVTLMAPYPCVASVEHQDQQRASILATACLLHLLVGRHGHPSWHTDVAL